MANANAKISGDFSSLIKGADDAAKSLVALSGKIAGLANPLNIATSAIGGTVTALGKIGLAAQGLEAIGKSAAAMGMGLLQGNANLEMTTISFQTLLGSASAANDMIKQLTAFAAATPFNLTGLEASTQKLLAFGYTSKQIIPLMTSLGDTVAALGGSQDNLNSLVYVFGQMHQEAHINAGDIMQMVNQGVPALQMLADHYHVTTGEIQQMISKGLIPGNEAVDIFTKGLEQKYGGMMAAQSSTFSGMISNLQDWATSTTIILTKPFFEPAKKALKAFLDYVQSPQGVAIINKMAADIQKGVDKATAAFVRFEPHIKPLLERLLQTANAVRQQMTPGIITLIPLLEKAWVRFEPLALTIWKVYQAIQPMNIAFAVLKGLLTGGVAGAVDAFKDRFALIEGYVKKGLDLALAAARRYGAQLLTWVADTAISLANKAVTWGEALIEWVAPYAGKLIGALIQLAERVVLWIVGYAPVIANQVLDWAEAIAGFVIPLIPRVLTLLVQLGLRVLSWIEKEAPILVKMLINWTDAMTGWVLPAIPGIISALEQVGAAILNWGINRLPVIIGQIVVGIGQGLGVNLQGVVQDLLKVFYALVNSIKNTLLPAFTQMTHYLASNLMPLFDRLTNFITRTVIPTAAALAAFVMTTLVPVFVNIADILGRLFGPALTLIGSIIRNELLPALSDSWDYFDGKYMPTVKDLASALGEKLAEGIRTATDKFEAAVPKLEAFYKKMEPIVGKALELYKALSPISIALDVLKGLLTGGLQGGLTALEQHVIDAGDAFGINLRPVIDWFNETVVTKVIPTLKEWAKTFIEKWWPNIRDAVVFVWNKLSDFWDFVSTKIWPPFKSFLDWLGEQFGKVGKSIGDTWENTIKPALATFGDYITKVLWPKLRDEVFPWIEKHVKPILETAFSILSEHIIPDLGKLVDILLNRVIPILVSWWGVMFALVNPFLKTAGDLIGKVVDGLKDSKDPLGKTTDGFKDLADKLKGVFDFLSKVVGGFHTLWFLMGGWLVGPIFDYIGNLVTMFGLVGDIVDKLQRGDIAGVAADAQKAIAIAKGQQIINGNGGQLQTSQQRLQQYMAAHPEYDPNAAGNAPRRATGDRNWRGGLVQVGEAGAELIRTASNQLMLATQPLLLNLGRGAQIYNNRETNAMFRSMPASGQQITNMYQNANSYRGGSYSNVNNYNLGVHTNQSPQVVQNSFGIMKVMYGRS